MNLNGRDTNLDGFGWKLDTVSTWLEAAAAAPDADAGASGQMVEYHAVVHGTPATLELISDAAAHVAGIGSVLRLERPADGRGFALRPIGPTTAVEAAGGLAVGMELGSETGLSQGIEALMNDTFFSGGTHFDSASSDHLWQLGEAGWHFVLVIDKPANPIEQLLGGLSANLSLLTPTDGPPPSEATTTLTGAAMGGHANRASANSDGSVTCEKDTSKTKLLHLQSCNETTKSCDEAVIGYSSTNPRTPPAAAVEEWSELGSSGVKYQFRWSSVAVTLLTPAAGPTLAAPKPTLCHSPSIAGTSWPHRERERGPLAKQSRRCCRSSTARAGGADEQGAGARRKWRQMAGDGDDSFVAAAL